MSDQNLRRRPQSSRLDLPATPDSRSRPAPLSPKMDGNLKRRKLNNGEADPPSADVLTSPLAETHGKFRMPRMSPSSDRPISARLRAGFNSQPRTSRGAYDVPQRNINEKPEATELVSHAVAKAAEYEINRRVDDLWSEDPAVAEEKRLKAQFERQSAELRQSLAELDCEQLVRDGSRFGALATRTTEEIEQFLKDPNTHLQQSSIGPVSSPSLESQLETAQDEITSLRLQLDEAQFELFDRNVTIAENTKYAQTVDRLEQEKIKTKESFVAKIVQLTSERNAAQEKEIAFERRMLSAEAQLQALQQQSSRQATALERKQNEDAEFKKKLTFNRWAMITFKAKCRSLAEKRNNLVVAVATVGVINIGLRKSFVTENQKLVALKRERVSLRCRQRSLLASTAVMRTNQLMQTPVIQQLRVQNHTLSTAKAELRMQRITENERATASMAELERKHNGRVESLKLVMGYVLNSRTQLHAANKTIRWDLARKIAQASLLRIWCLKITATHVTNNRLLQQRLHTSLLQNNIQHFLFAVRTRVVRRKNTEIAEAKERIQSLGMELDSHAANNRLLHQDLHASQLQNSGMRFLLAVQTSVVRQKSAAIAVAGGQIRSLTQVAEVLLVSYIYTLNCFQHAVHRLVLFIHLIRHCAAVHLQTCQRSTQQRTDELAAIRGQHRELSIFAAAVTFKVYQCTQQHRSKVEHIQRMKLELCWTRQLGAWSLRRFAAEINKTRAMKRTLDLNSTKNVALQVSISVAVSVLRSRKSKIAVLEGRLLTARRDQLIRSCLLTQSVRRLLQTKQQITQLQDTCRSSSDSKIRLEDEFKRFRQEAKNRCHQHQSDIAAILNLDLTIPKTVLDTLGIQCDECTLSWTSDIDVQPSLLSFPNEQQTGSENELQRALLNMIGRKTAKADDLFRLWRQIGSGSLTTTTMALAKTLADLVSNQDDQPLLSRWVAMEVQCRLGVPGSLIRYDAPKRLELMLHRSPNLHFQSISELNGRDTVLSMAFDRDLGLVLVLVPLMQGDGEIFRLQVSPLSDVNAGCRKFQYQIKIFGETTSLATECSKKYVSWLKM